MTTYDNVNHPKHYTSDPSGVECIQITRHRDFNIGNAIKYLWRAGLKEGASTKEELEKAIWYIQDEIKLLFPEPDKPEFDLRTNPNMYTCFVCLNHKESNGEWISHNGNFYHSLCFKGYMPKQWAEYSEYTGNQL